MNDRADPSRIVPPPVDLTGRTVLAFSALAALSRADRACTLAEIAANDPAFAAQLDALLDAADVPTRIMTSFGDALESRSAATESDAPSDRTPIAAGSRLGDFVLVERIGAGGMGEIWRARQRDPERDVALKILRRDRPLLAAWSGAHEKRALAALRHPAIAAIHASGMEPDGTSWIATEFVEGASDLVHAGRARPIRERVRLLAQVADAVAHAHARGFLHRDLKPSNVLVGADGLPKVIDFGIAIALSAAHATDLLLRMGTLAYMPPESLDADPTTLDARADVYALGAILHELVHGALPTELASGDPIRILRALGSELGGRDSTKGHSSNPSENRSRRQAVSPFVPPSGADRATRRDLAAIIARATAVDPDCRYPTAAAFAEDLRAFLADRPIAAAPRGPVGRTWLAARRNPVAATLAGAAVLALGAGTVTSLAFASHARRAAIEAGELATQTAAVYDSFLDLFLPQDLDPALARETTLADYLRTRVGELESMAGEIVLSDRLGGIGGLAQTLQYSCLSLGLPDEAARCALVREIVEARIAEPRGYLVDVRHLDAVYTRLACDPDDSTARDALDSLVSAMLSSQRVVRSGSLSVIAGVDFLHENAIGEEVAERLVAHADASPEVLVSAVSRLVLGVEAAAARGSVGERERRMLTRAVEILDPIVHGVDAAAAAEARSLASSVDLRFSARLAVARHPTLIEPLLEFALLAGSGRSDGSIDLNFFDGVPIRLAQLGEWDACEKSIAAIDRRIAAIGRRLEPDSDVTLSLARLQFALARHGPREINEAMRLLETSIAIDPDESSTPYLRRLHASGLVGLGEAAVRIGDAETIDRAIDRSRRIASSASDDMRGHAHRWASDVLAQLRASFVGSVPETRSEDPRDPSPSPVPESP